MSGPGAGKAAHNSSDTVHVPPSPVHDSCSVWKSCWDEQYDNENNTMTILLIVSDSIIHLLSVTIGPVKNEVILQFNCLHLKY